MILSICTNPNVLEVMRLINMFITIIQIAVPIILIFVLMLKFAQAIVKNDQDALQKTMRTIPYNITATVLIFLVPTLVSLVVNISFPNSEYKKCLNVKTIAEVNVLYEAKMEELINKAEETLNLNDYLNAYNYLNYIKNDVKKSEYKKQLQELKDKIDKSNKVSPISTGIPIIVETAKKYIDKNVGTDCSGFVKNLVLGPTGYLHPQVASTSASCDGRSRGSNGMYRKYIELGSIVWQRPSSAQTLSEAMLSFPGDCAAGDVLFYSYGANDCVKHVVIYTGYENGKNMIVDSNMFDHTVRYRGVDEVHSTAIPLACARPVKNGE